MDGREKQGEERGEERRKCNINGINMKSIKNKTGRGGDRKMYALKENKKAKRRRSMLKIGGRDGERM